MTTTSNDPHASTAPHTPSVQTRSVGLLIALIGLSIFGSTMAYLTPQYLSLALRLAVIAPDSATTDLSALLGAGVLVQIIALLLAGRLSDATRSRLGMRRPWIIAGTLLIVLGCVVLAAADVVPLLWVGFLAIEIGSGLSYAAMNALIPDQVPPRRQGIATGVAGAAGIAGALAGLFVVQLAPENTFVVFILPGLVAAVPALALCFVMRDRRLREKIRITLVGLLGSFVVNPRKTPSLTWYLVVVFLIGTVSAMIGTYSYFLIGAKLEFDLTATASAVFIGGLILNLIGFFVSLAVGALSDRIGRRKPFVAIAAVVLAAGGLLTAFTPDLTALYVGYAVVGVGTGLLLGSYLALAIETMTEPTTVARDINAVLAVQLLTGAAVPLVAPLLLGANADNYTALLLVGVAASLLSLGFLWKVKAR